jgi:hypothetical protein
MAYAVGNEQVGRLEVMGLTGRPDWSKMRENMDRWFWKAASIRREVCLLLSLPKDRLCLHRIASDLAGLSAETNRAGYLELYEEALKAQCFVFDVELETRPGEAIATYPILRSLDSFRIKLMAREEEICWRIAPVLDPSGSAFPERFKIQGIS